MRDQTSFRAMLAIFAIGLSALVGSAGCAAITVDVENTCTESQLVFTRVLPDVQDSALVASAMLDFAMLRVKGTELAISGSTTTLELGPAQRDAIAVLDATIALEGEAPTRVLHLTISDAERASGRIDLGAHLDDAKMVDRLTRGKVKVAYYVSARRQLTELTAKTKTCVASTVRWDKNALK